MALPMEQTIIAKLLLENEPMPKKSHMGKMSYANKVGYSTGNNMSFHRGGDPMGKSKSSNKDTKWDAGPMKKGGKGMKSYGY